MVMDFEKLFPGSSMGLGSKIMMDVGKYIVLIQIDMCLTAHSYIVVSHYHPGTPAVTPVVIVTLNRPTKHNAFTPQMVMDFEKLTAGVPGW
jgi:hypothetical protein